MDLQHLPCRGLHVIRFRPFAEVDRYRVHADFNFQHRRGSGKQLHVPREIVESECRRHNHEPQWPEGGVIAVAVAVKSRSAKLDCARQQTDQNVAVD